jgi:nicotinate dehydrogenase subunit B
MTHDVAISRRDLLKAGGAFIVSVGLLPQARLALAAATGKPPGSLATAAALDAWMRINADGTVMAFTGKVEIGPGHYDSARASRGGRAGRVARPAAPSHCRH